MEEWKEIENYHGLYWVSTLGNVKSRKTAQLSKIKQRKGYLSVYLFKDGIVMGKKIHRLVAQAFIENPNNKEQVNHKDGNKGNNTVENLEWVTGSENVLHSFRTGLSYPRHGTLDRRAKLTDEAVLIIRSLKGTISNRKIAKQYSVDPALINGIMNGTRWKHLTT